MSIAKLEGVERDSRAEQTGAKVKLVDFSSRIDETHRLELGVSSAIPRQVPLQQAVH
jgi:hypothetical protein